MVKKLFVALVAGLFMAFSSGCATHATVAKQIEPLEERVSKLEKTSAAALEEAVKKVAEAAARAEDAAKKAEDAAGRSDAAAKKAEEASSKAEAASKRAETAADKAAKAFELMQKK
jgi:methyl-accepting chemotaxis protein